MGVSAKALEAAPQGRTAGDLASPPRLGHLTPDMEHIKNDYLPAKFAFRLEDLRPWHVVRASCVACGRKVVLPQEVLWRGRSRHERLVDLEKCLRCTRCGQRGMHRLDISLAPRN